MELKFNIHVAETAELKILLAEFEWLCELLADEMSKSNLGSDFLFQNPDVKVNLEFEDIANRFERRLGRYRAILADEAALVVMGSVLSKVKTVIGSGS